MKKKVAAFDFDGTITRKDTLWEFLKFSRTCRELIAGLLFLSPMLVLYKLKVIPNSRAKEKLFGYFFKGMELEEFNRKGRAFSEKIEEMIRPQVFSILEKHQQAGDSVIIISASLENWIIDWASKKGIEQVLATKSEIDIHGKLTGRFSSPNCYGQEKVNRLSAFLPDRESYYLYAYGDSKGDQELLQFADEGYLVTSSSCLLVKNKE